MTLRRVPAWLVATVLTLVVGAVATAAPVRAQDRCDGVQVVVDATALGGGLTTRCAAGDPATGLEALREAGHSYAFVPRQPGLVCTIDARPDPCNGAPQDAYWSYWHAPAGGAWTYSNRGAGNRDPEPGTVEGWAFGAGDPPGRPPPAPAAGPEPDPAPEEPAAPDAEPAPEPTDDRDDPTGAPQATTAGDAPRAAGPASPSPTPAPEEPGGVTDAPTLTEPPGPAPDATISPVEDEAFPSPGPDVVTTARPGIPVGLVLGGLLVIAVGVAAAVRARRRTHGG